MLPRPQPKSNLSWLFHETFLKIHDFSWSLQKEFHGKVWIKVIWSEPGFSLIKANFTDSSHVFGCWKLWKVCCCWSSPRITLDGLPMRAHSAKRKCSNLKFPKKPTAGCYISTKTSGKPYFFIAGGWSFNPFAKKYHSDWTYSARIRGKNEQSLIASPSIFVNVIPKHH